HILDPHSFPTRRSSDLLDCLSKLHQEMVHSESGESYVELNADFHKLLFSRCNSPRLLGFIETISHGFAQDTPQIIPGQIQKSNKDRKSTRLNSSHVSIS